jgi:hypothetical protein
MRSPGLPFRPESGVETLQKVRDAPSVRPQVRPPPARGGLQLDACPFRQFWGEPYDHIVDETPEGAARFHSDVAPDGIAPHDPPAARSLGHGERGVPHLLDGAAVRARPQARIRVIGFRPRPIPGERHPEAVPTQDVVARSGLRDGGGE